MLDFHRTPSQKEKLIERPIVALLVFVGAFGVLSGLFALGNRTNLPLVYQGRLTDANYLPITDSARNIRFKVWTASSGGSCVWSTGSGTGSANCGSADSASAVSVNVSNGNFTVPLGNAGTNNPEITLDFSSGLFYLEVIADNENPVGTYETLSPRKQISGSAYAYVANDLVGGQIKAQGRASATLTGSIDATASTSVAGVGTLFTTELSVGDRITIDATTAETHTVTAIASDTSLTVDSAFTDQANDTSVLALYAIATMKDSGGVVRAALSDLGRFNIGTQPNSVGGAHLSVFESATTSGAIVSYGSNRDAAGGQAIQMNFLAPMSAVANAKNFQSAVNVTPGNAHTNGWNFRQANDAMNSTISLLSFVHGGTNTSGGQMAGGVIVGNTFDSVGSNWLPPTRGLIVSGRTGIATNTPAQEFDVQGSALIATRDTEKVTNPRFATGTCDNWTLGTGWACDTTDSEVDHTAGNTAALEQNVSAVAGETYVVSFTTRLATAGSVTPSVGGVAGTAVTANQLHSQTIIATGTGNLQLTPTSSFNGSIDDVSVRKLNGGNLYAMGSVGIGTTAPLFNLHVIAPTNTNAALLQVGRTDGISQGALRLYNTDTIDNSGVAMSFMTDTTGAGATPRVGLASMDGIFTSHNHSTRSGALTFTTVNNGTSAEKLRITSNGSVGIGTTTPLARLDLAGNLRTTGKATAALTGSIDPTASTAVVGVGTLFTAELVVGDRITVTGETRTVIAITDNLNLTVDSAFTDTANDTAVDALYALGTFRDSAGTTQVVINDLGNLGIGDMSPSQVVEVRRDQNSSAQLIVRNGNALGNTLARADVAVASFDSSGNLAAFPSDFANSTLFDRVQLVSNSNASKGLLINTGLATAGIAFGAGGTGRDMFLRHDGNLGIGGDPRPAQRLDVDGSALVATRGSEKVTNDEFGTSCSGWTLGSGWTCDVVIQNSLDGSEVDHTSGTAVLEQNVSAIAGETYVVDFTVRNRTAGSVTAAVGGVSGTLRSANGEYAEVITATGSGNLTFTPTTDFDGSIDDASVKKLTGGNLYAMGNVGIGTITPTNLLTMQYDQNALTVGSLKNGIIAGNTSAGALFRVESSSSSGNIAAYPADYSPTAVYQDEFVVRSNSDAAGLRLEAGGSSPYMRFVVGATANERMRIDSNGHVEYTGTAPVVSACGTSPTIVGSDMVGQVTIGTTPGATCTVTFATTWTNAPVCMANNETTANLVRATSTTTVLTLSGTLTAGDVVGYVCAGRR